MTFSNDDMFDELVEAHGADLHVHCYRMLGSLHDADDAVQDTLLRAWRALGNFRGQSSHRTWLYRIATNVCLDAIARRSKRVLPVDYGPGDPRQPLDDAIWIEPFPDQLFSVERGRAEPEARYEQREAVELAFIAALQHLPPRQRAVLILRDVLGFSAKETADALDTTVPAVNGALQRARQAAANRLPEQSQQSALRAHGDEQLRDLVDRFVRAFERGDIDAILASLAEDATFCMPPYPGVWRGRDAIGRSWLMPGGPPPRLRYVETTANGQLAVGTYLLDPKRRSYVPLALDVLAVGDGLIVDIIAFRAPSLFRRFGLPDRLSAEAPPAWHALAGRPPA
jgi:RNA polymerase sigma-70 factor (ECF subfamily)